MLKNQTKFKQCVPVLIILCILPFITRLHLYTTDMEAFSWYGLDEELSDFFSYAKAVIFSIVVFYMAAEIVWEMLQGRLKIERNLYVYLFAGATICILLSTICAQNKQLAAWGGYQRFEGMVVLIGYMITYMYTYYFIKDWECWKILLNGLVITVAILCFIAFLQIIGKDSVFFQWVQNLIIPSSMNDIELDSRVRTNTVYATLANANYASMYFAGVLPVLLMYAGNSKGKKRVGILFVAVAAFVSMIFTYSRIGLVMLVAVLFAAIWMCRNVWRKHWKKCTLGLISAVILFVALDGLTGFRFGERILLTVQSFQQERKNCELEELRTEQDGIYFSLPNVSVRMYAKYGLQEQNTIRLELKDGTDITKNYQEDTGEIDYSGLEDVTVFVSEIEDEPMLLLCVGETAFRFVKDEQNGYLFYVGNGKYDTIQSVEQIGFSGIEHMASGRFYVWSRTLPLLKKYGLLGCGADNFYLIYPQNDYLGKAQYCNTPLTIVEKPHNTYLMVAVQNGIPALVFFIVLYVLYAKESFKLYSGKQQYTSKEWLGLGIFLFSIAYMVGYLFIDSSVNISPLFWILIAMGKRQKTQLKLSAKL